MSTAVWDVVSYPSGTMNVELIGKPGPHYYVFGPRGANEKETEINRRVVCEELSKFLNGGVRPLWFNDLKRNPSHTSCFDWDGTSISAMGPYVATPEVGKFAEDITSEAVQARIDMIDRILG